MNTVPVTTPVVSIITVCFNSEKTIHSTLESVATQDYSSIEHIIIDGKSSDQTLNIVLQFPHVQKIVSEKDKGIYNAMNKGIKMATGDIIGILNSDDFYTGPEVISQVVKKLTENNHDSLYADLLYVDSVNTSKKIRTWKAGAYQRNKFLYGWMPPHPTFFVRRSVYEQFGTFNEQLRSAADYELMLRFLYKNNISVTYLPATIVKMRAGGNSNASLSNRFRANREDRKAWDLNAMKPYFFTTWLKPLRKLTQFIS